MRVLQITNIISHHQLPLARCLAEHVGTDNFRFAVTELPDAERTQLGWNCDEQESWILRPAEVEADRLEFERWWDEADVVICGERLLTQIKQRLDRGKLTFYMSERWGKPPIGMARLLSPRYAAMAHQFRRLASSPHFHYLPMGGYAARDMRWIARFRGRMWRWGYFMSTPVPLPSCSRRGAGFQVLWAGRMLDWKRVDTLIRAFSKLLAVRPDATLTLVGEGPERKSLEQLAEKLLPPGSYRFMPFRPVSEITMLMRHHHVYVLPSNAYEGWGAVVNEAMAEGCVVIASNAAGSAGSIIRHGDNGLLFAPGDWQRLGDLLCAVAGDEEMRARLARAGQECIVGNWSPKVAADRLLTVARSLLAGQPAPSYDDGPMCTI
jgi:glycosyltransferase involved in cell wall biosynthesis